jgi:hypothetical protein
MPDLLQAGKGGRHSEWMARRLRAAFGLLDSSSLLISSVSQENIDWKAQNVLTQALADIKTGLPKELMDANRAVIGMVLLAGMPPSVDLLRLD